MKRILSTLCLCACVHLMGNEIDTWSSPPDTISTTGVNASHPHIGMDAAGNVVALWLEGDVVISKTKLLGESWSASETISPSGSSTPQLVVDPATGEAIAVWNEGGIIKSANKHFGSSWRSAVALSASGSSSPQIAINPANGDCVAVWVTDGVVMAETWVTGSGWSNSPKALSTANSAFPQVAIGINGAVTAVWHTLNPVTALFNINAASKTIGGSWSTATLVSDPNTNSAYPQISVDQNGNSIAVWFRYAMNGSQYSNVALQSSKLPHLGSWTIPVDVSLPGVINPAELMAKVILDGSGRGLAVWTTGMNDSTFTIQSSSSADLSHWDCPTTLDSSLYSYSIDVATNSNGDALGIYMTYDSTNDAILINTTESHIGGINGGFWTYPNTISNNVNNGFPQIQSAISGTACNAIAAWTSFDGANTIIQAATGTGAIVEPPVNPTVAQLIHNREVFQEYYNVLSWTASPDPTLSAYGIYRNNVLIDVIDASLLSYFDDNQPQNGPVTYGVSAFDNANEESAVVTVSFP